jgi:hypothetical protein
LEALLQFEEGSSSKIDTSPKEVEEEKSGKEDVGT